MLSPEELLSRVWMTWLDKGLLRKAGGVTRMEDPLHTPQGNTGEEILEEDSLEAHWRNTGV